MNEFVLVTFFADTAVNVDGTPTGFTNKKMIVETGTHTFDLGNRTDYTPKSITKTVVGSSIEDPFTVQFKKVSS